MYKLIISVYKEMLLLSRDLGGLIILFVMPLILVVTITLIQDSTFKEDEERKINVLVVDYDNSQLSSRIINNLKQSKSFNLIDSINGTLIDEKKAESLVYQGDYPIALVIPQNVSSDLQRKVSKNISKIMSNMGVSDDKEQDTSSIQPKEIRLYFDPATKISLKNGLINAIDVMISKIEKQEIYKSIQEELGEENAVNFGDEEFIRYSEVQREEVYAVKPNSVQHNVPAWTLFAIFFIVIPLSINMVKERKQGTKVRLFTSPVSYSTIIMGKTICYMFICMLQFYIMVLIGVYLFPKIGLYALDVNGKLGLMSIIALFAALSAVGFSILVGTFFKTQEQSAPFGAISVIILSAIGGIWVPIYLMPKILQYTAYISPMNWGIEAFYNVLLRNGNFISIIPQLLFLLLFFIINILLSILIDRYRTNV